MSKPRHRINKLLLSPIVIVAALTAACSRPAVGPNSAAGGGAPDGPVEVNVVTMHEQAVPIATELPGRTSPYRVAEVRPQVSGVVQKRLFAEGGEVMAGQPLYQIDPAPFQASLASAVAALDRAKATQTSARLLAERNKPLVDAHAVSQQDYDDAVAAQQQAAADVASAQASVQTARINLAYTRVLSPISGRTGRSTITEGALVTANQADALVTVQQLDPIYVDLTQTSTNLLRLRRELDAGHLVQTGKESAEVVLKLEDGSDYGTPGTLQFSEVTVDQGTGAVTLRAEFPNPGKQLLPGMFVHAQLQEGMRQAYLVPQQGVSHSPTGEATAMVVGANDQAEARVLKTDRTIGADWLVTDGLKPGDRVIVSGIQKLRPGSKLAAREGQPGAAPATASTDSSALPHS